MTIVQRYRLLNTKIIFLLLGIQFNGLQPPGHFGPGVQGLFGVEGIPKKRYNHLADINIGVMWPVSLPSLSNDSAYCEEKVYASVYDRFPDAKVAAEGLVAEIDRARVVILIASEEQAFLFIAAVEDIIPKRSLLWIATEGWAPYVFYRPDLIPFLAGSLLVNFAEWNVPDFDRWYGQLKPKSALGPVRRNNLQNPDVGGPDVQPPIARQAVRDPQGVSLGLTNGQGWWSHWG
ncbi:hypothetical protein ACOMHN_052662 [Nucella lapillus]